MYALSDCFEETQDKELQVIENESIRIRSMIEKRHAELLGMIESEKATLLVQIEDYIRLIASK